MREPETVEQRLAFLDRREAGRVLAQRLLRYAGRADAIVLGLPRGGVPVAYEVARELRLPLDVLIVRKLGVPGYEELAMGAIASGGTRVLNEDVIAQLPEPERLVDYVAAKEMLELERREAQYRAGRPAPDLRGKTVILVDDGLATGASMRVAVKALRERNVASCVVAVPVAASQTCAEMRTEADDVVCAITPPYFRAVGDYFEDFSQTSDEEVRALLASATRDGARPTGDGARSTRDGART